MLLKAKIVLGIIITHEANIGGSNAYQISITPPALNLPVEEALPFST